MSALTLRNGTYEGSAGKWEIGGIEILVVAPSRLELLEIMSQFRPDLTFDESRFALVQVEATSTKNQT